MRTLLDVGLSSVRSPEEGEFEVTWWQFPEGGGVGGVGFTIRGSRITEFLTRSDFSSIAVWAADDSVHVVHDLLRRGLQLPEGEVERFLEAWRRAFAIYQRSRKAAPPKTITPQEGRALFRAFESALPVSPAAEEESDVARGRFEMLQRARKDLA